VPEPVLPRLPLAPHGGPDGSDERPLDFSINSNPFGPPPALLDYLRGVDISSYPDPTYAEARKAAATHHGVSPEHIVPGGAAELIYRLCTCYLNAGRTALVAAPTFGEYGRAARLYGAAVQLCPVYSKEAEPDAHALVQAVREARPALVWVCHPNSPTGHAWSVEALAEIAAACQRCDALLVIDAAYLELSDAVPNLPENAVKLFPLTKTFAVAGLRAGYAVCPAEVAETLSRAAPPWPVSSPAAAAVRWCRSPAGIAFVTETVPELLRLRHSFQTDLRRLGFGVWAGHSSFFLAQVGDAAAFAARARAAGFRVRDASSLGLPGCVRLAAQREADNAAFLQWLAC
jgi:histidinol-phosphate aminotransferase